MARNSMYRYPILSANRPQKRTTNSGWYGWTKADKPRPERGLSESVNTEIVLQIQRNKWKGKVEARNSDRLCDTHTGQGCSPTTRGNAVGCHSVRHQKPRIVSRGGPCGEHKKGAPPTDRTSLHAITLIVMDTGCLSCRFLGRSFRWACFATCRRPTGIKLRACGLLWQVHRFDDVLIRTHESMRWLHSTGLRSAGLHLTGCSSRMGTCAPMNTCAGSSARMYTTARGLQSGTGGWPLLRGPALPAHHHGTCRH